jgi:hypothetical protein
VWLSLHPWGLLLPMQASALDRISCMLRNATKNDATGAATVMAIAGTDTGIGDIGHHPAGAGIMPGRGIGGGVAA